MIADDAPDEPDRPDLGPDPDPDATRAALARRLQQIADVLGRPVESFHALPEDGHEVADLRVPGKPPMSGTDGA